MEMDGLMLEVLKEQKNKGQKEDRAFSAEAYRKVVDEINDKFSLNINKSKVLNRLKTLKEQMVLTKEIEQKSGVGWNDITKTFEATAEVWKLICLANPKFKSIRGKHLYHLDILKEIYDKDMATEVREETAKQNVRRWERENTDISIEDIDELQANNEVHLENFNLFDNESGPTTPDIANAIVSTSAEVWKTCEIRAALVKLGLKGRPLFQAMELLVANPTFVGVFW
ncbi:hypothetical protein PIB30_076911 [Stylosanthes scabra]|uniref:Myb/SANT-like domain-containing protein n=1 Tax=Stylosanthes scabra TaxID=79078 RepID=A0ABU6RQP2_9FABA|nr:hypothetical protein [Stylosanthes scabra]